MKNKLQPIQSSLLTCSHGFFERQGGVSEGLFDSLNCGLHKGDQDEHVFENRRRVAEHFALQPENLCLIVQTHSNHPYVIHNLKDYKGNPLPKGDALITQQKNIILGVLTADCGPILLHDPVNHIVAAIHAGWRSAVSGIIQNTIGQMIHMGTKPSDIEAAIGPCLWEDHFEVQDDFITEAKNYLDIVRYVSHCGSSIKFNLPLLLQHLLEKEGIQKISPSPIDTYSAPEKFFSYRRKTHHQEDAFGVQISCITNNILV